MYYDIFIIYIFCVRKLNTGPKPGYFQWEAQILMRKHIVIFTSRGDRDRQRIFGNVYAILIFLPTCLDAKFSLWGGWRLGTGDFGRNFEQMTPFYPSLWTRNWKKRRVGTENFLKFFYATDSFLTSWYWTGNFYVEGRVGTDDFRRLFFGIEDFLNYFTLLTHFIFPRPEHEIFKSRGMVATEDFGRFLMQLTVFDPIVLDRKFSKSREGIGTEDLQKLFAQLTQFLRTLFWTPTFHVEGDIKRGFSRIFVQHVHFLTTGHEIFKSKGE